MGFSTKNHHCKGGDCMCVGGELRVVRDGKLILEDGAVVEDPNGLLGGGSGGGVTSWNDLTDKPFGEMTDPLLFEGENFDKLSNNVDGAEPPNQGTNVRVYCGGSSFGEAVFDAVWEYNDDGYDGGYIVIDDEDTNLHFMVNINVPGSYNIRYATEETPRILEKLRVVISGTVIKTIDEQFLPKIERVDYVEDAPTADDFNNLIDTLRSAGYMDW